MDWRKHHRRTRRARATRRTRPPRPAQRADKATGRTQSRAARTDLAYHGFSRGMAGVVPANSLLKEGPDDSGRTSPGVPRSATASRCSYFAGNRRLGHSSGGHGPEAGGRQRSANSAASRTRGMPPPQQYSQWHAHRGARALRAAESSAEQRPGVGPTLLNRRGAPLCGRSSAARQPLDPSPAAVTR